MSFLTLLKLKRLALVRKGLTPGMCAIQSGLLLEHVQFYSAIIAGWEGS